MTEDDARAWMAARHGQERLERLHQLEGIVREEAGRQNLVSPSTLTAIWARHFVDSAQLLSFAPSSVGSWLDVGTGAGFPGLVIAILRGEPITFAEPRGRRVSFLREAADRLGLPHVDVKASKVEALSGRFDVITARAVASTERLLAATAHLRHRDTALIFPRGRGGVAELASLPLQWQSLFHVEQSVTDPESAILVANGAP